MTLKNNSLVIEASPLVIKQAVIMISIANVPDRS
jgi:hypothetical protein